MPWFIILGIGFLTGFAITNAWLRHHALTLIIWISKASMWIMNGLVLGCEWLQDKFDDLDYLPNTKVQTKLEQPQKIKEQKVEKPKGIDFTTATTEDVLQYIHDHPEQVSVKRKGGE
jgi:hypothetical protein